MLTKREAFAPRWSLILLLVALGLAIAWGAQYFADPADPVTHLDPSPKTEETKETWLARLAKSGGAGEGGGVGAMADSPRGQLSPPGPIISSASSPLATLSPESRGESPALAREIPRLTKEMGRPVAVVSATIVDSQGSPIAGVQARLGDREAVSDSAGELVLPRKDADLILSHPDYLPRTIDVETRHEIALPDSPPDNERLIVVMFDGGRVAGKVVNSMGSPVVGAKIFFDGDQGQGATSDASGFFRSPIFRPGLHRLHIHHPEYQRSDATVSIAPRGGEVSYVATLKPGVPISIQTVDSSGAPVPDASLWLTSPRDEGGSGETRLAGRTADDGRLTILWNPAAPHVVRVLVPGFREAVKPLSGKSMTVRLKPAPLLTGQVVDRKEGLARKPQQLVLEVETPGGFRRAPPCGIIFQTLASGKFRVGLPPFAGVYRVRVQGEGDLEGFSRPIDFDGQTSPAPTMVYLEPRTGLRGRVLGPFVGGGTGPVAGARVEIYHDDPTGEALRHSHGVWFTAPPALLRATESDAAGEFSLKDLKPADDYRLKISHPDHATWVHGPITIPVDSPLSCTLGPGATLRGTVLDRGGSPEPGVPLILASQSPRVNPFTLSTRSDPSGRYRFENVAPGGYLLLLGDPDAEGGPATQTRWTRAQKRPRQGERHEIRVEAGAEMIFDIRRGSGLLGSLSGAVWAGGRPFSGISLFVTRVPAERSHPTALSGESEMFSPPEWESEGEIEVTTDTGGGFLLEGLLPGTYHISSGGNVRHSVARTVTVESGKTTNFSVSLETLTYRASFVDGPSGEPLDLRGVASVIPRDPEGGSQRRPIRTAPIIEGKIEIPGLFPGRYRLRVEAPGYAPMASNFELTAVAPGSTPFRTLVVWPGFTVRVEVVGPGNEPFGGTLETVLLRDGVEIHRWYGKVDGVAPIPILPRGRYVLTIRSGNDLDRLELDVTGDMSVRATLGK